MQPRILPSALMATNLLCEPGRMNMALVSGSSSVNRPTASVSSPRIISIIPKLSRSTGPAKLRTPGMKWIGNGAISGKVCVRIASCRSPTDAGAGTCRISSSPMSLVIMPYATHFFTSPAPSPFRASSRSMQARSVVFRY